MHGIHKTLSFACQKRLLQKEKSSINTRPLLQMGSCRLYCVRSAGWWPHLTAVFSKSFESGVIPEDWRLANMTPCMRKGTMSVRVTTGPAAIHCWKKARVSSHTYSCHILEKEAPHSDYYSPTMVFGKYDHASNFIFCLTLCLLMAETELCILFT